MGEAGTRGEKGAGGRRIRLIEAYLARRAQRTGNRSKSIAQEQLDA